MAKKYINLPTEEINDRLAKIPELETGKQDVIENLDDIISGAKAGSTALQPVEGKGLSAVTDAVVTEDGKLNIEKQDGTVIEFEGGGGIPDAPSDGKQYARKNGEWSKVEGGDGGYTKPDDGIPLSDLSETLRTSISRADTIYTDYINAQNLM